MAWTKKFRADRYQDHHRSEHSSIWTTYQASTHNEKLDTLHPEPYPEVNSEGIPIHLKSAPKTVDKAPQIPDPNYQPPSRAGVLPSPNFETGPRRSPRFLESSSIMETLHLDVTKLTSLVCKDWRGTLMNGHTVLVKLWDGWKFSSSDSEHEAFVYYHLLDLWATIIHDFIGFGQWAFCHILLISDLEVYPIHSCD
jgi:hypothetical protein